VDDRGYGIDRATQAWVRATGRRVDFVADAWLSGPIGDPRLIGDAWLPGEARRLGGTLSEGGGLLGSASDPAGKGFDPAALASPIVDFYEHTDQWRLEVWSQWCPLAWPFGWLLAALFSRRLRQLSMPLRPLDVAHGMASRVFTVHDAERRQLGAAWLRTLRATGQTVYSGFYGIAQLPKSERPSIGSPSRCQTATSPSSSAPTTATTGGSSSPHRWPSSATTAPTWSSPTETAPEPGYVASPLRNGSRSMWTRRKWLELIMRSTLWQVPAIRLHYRMDRIR
jgi:hypothetical protein